MQVPTSCDYTTTSQLNRGPVIRKQSPLDYLESNLLILKSSLNSPHIQEIHNFKIMRSYMFYCFMLNLSIKFYIDFLATSSYK